MSYRPEIHVPDGGTATGDEATPMNPAEDETANFTDVAGLMDDPRSLPMDQLTEGGDEPWSAMGDDLPEMSAWMQGITAQVNAAAADPDTAKHETREPDLPENVAAPRAADDGFVLDTRLQWGSEAANLELPLSRRSVPLLGDFFENGVVESEYQRFIYRRGLIFVGVLTTLAAAAFPIYLTMLESISGAVSFVVTITAVFLALTAIISFALEGARYHEQKKLDVIRDRDAIADTEHIFVMRHRLLVCVALPIFAAGASITTMLAADSCVMPPMAPPDVRRPCTDSFREAFSFPIAALFFIIRSPIPAVFSAIGLTILIPIFELGFMESDYEPAEVWVRTVICLLFSLTLAGMSAWRDRASRRHFEALITSHVNHELAIRKSAELAAVVSAALPLSVAVRAAKASGGVNFDSGRSIFNDSSETATICATRPSNFFAFARQHLVHNALSGLSHLVTLFDMGARVFDVDNCGFDGDTFIVASGLVEGSRATPANVVRFALWQHGLPEVAALPLRSGIVTGVASGGLVGSTDDRFEMRYQTAGPAVCQAVSLVARAPAQCVYASDTTVRALRRYGIDADRVDDDTWRISRLAASTDGLVDSSVSRASAYRPANSSEVQINVNSQSITHYSSGGSGSGTGQTRTPQTRALAAPGAASSPRGEAPSARPSPLQPPQSSESLDGPSSANAEGSATNALESPAGSAPDSSTNTESQRDKRKKKATSATPLLGLIDAEIVVPVDLRAGSFVDESMEVDFVKEIDDALADRAAFAALPVAGVSVITGAMHLISVASNRQTVFHPSIIGLALAAFLLSAVALSSLLGVLPTTLRPLGHGVGIALASLGLWVAITFLPTSGVRNDPSFLPIGFGAIPIGFVLLRFSRPWLTGLAAGIVVQLPAFVSGRMSALNAAVVVLLICVIVAIVYSMAVTARVEYGSSIVARRKEDAAGERNQYLQTTSKRLMPDEVAKHGIDGAVLFELQVLSQPIESTSQHSNARTVIDTRLARLGDLCRRDFGQGMAHGFKWFVTAVVVLLPTSTPSSTDSHHPSLETYRTLDEQLAKACTKTCDAQVLRTLNCLGDTVIVGGPFKDLETDVAATAACRFIRSVPSALDGRYTIAVGLAVEEAVGMIMSRGSMRFGVHGPSPDYGRALAESAASVAPFAKLRPDEPLVFTTKHFRHICPYRGVDYHSTTSGACAHRATGLAHPLRMTFKARS